MYLLLVAGGLLRTMPRWAPKPKAAGSVGAGLFLGRLGGQVFSPAVGVAVLQQCSVRSVLAAMPGAPFVAFFALSSDARSP